MPKLVCSSTSLLVGLLAPNHSGWETNWRQLDRPPKRMRPKPTSERLICNSCARARYLATPNSTAPLRTPLVRISGRQTSWHDRFATGWHPDCFHCQLTDRMDGRLADQRHIWLIFRVNSILLAAYRSPRLWELPPPCPAARYRSSDRIDVWTEGKHSS